MQNSQQILVGIAGIDRPAKPTGQRKRCIRVLFTVACVLWWSLLCPFLYQIAILFCLLRRKSGWASLPSLADGLHPLPVSGSAAGSENKKPADNGVCRQKADIHCRSLQIERLHIKNAQKPWPSSYMGMAAKIGNGYHLDQLPWSRLTILAYGRSQIQ